MTTADTSLSSAAQPSDDPATLIRELSVSTQVMQRISDGVLALVPDATFASVLRPDGDGLTMVCASGLGADAVGHRQTVRGTLAGLSLQHGEMLVSDCPAEDPRVDPVVRAHPNAGSLLTMPLTDAGTDLGVVVVASTRHAAFGPGACSSLDAVRGLITSGLRAVIELSEQVRVALAGPDPSRQLDAEDLERVGAFLRDFVEPGQSRRLAERRRVVGVLHEARLDIAVQPIIDVTTGQTLWAEALSRFPTPPRRGPDEWFAEAHRVGLGLDLEELALTRALAVLGDLGEDVGLSVNVSPEMLVSPRLPALFAGVAAERLIVEVTEHERCEDYPRARRAIAQLRECGARICIDDVGAGFCSFRHVVELVPDVIKLDRSFTAGIEGDEARRAMAQALVAFGSSMGIALVAEGIETERQLRAIRTLGVGWGQGYLIARPGPAPHVKARYDAG